MTSYSFDDLNNFNPNNIIPLVTYVIVSTIIIYYYL